MFSLKSVFNEMKTFYYCWCLLHILNCKFYYKPHAFENMVTDIMFYYRIIYLLELVVSDELCLVTLKD
jgi:hypothetical protein